MATLAPYPPQPLASSSRSPSPGPEHITYSKVEIDYPDSTRDHDMVPLTGHGSRRSPSPTPSEKLELKEFEGTLAKLFRKESWKNKAFLFTVGTVFVLISLTVVIAVYHHRIVTALMPAANWVKRTPGGFLIPIAILIILSIPPLFGAEVIHLLCGFIYGLGIGFLILCVGTVLGEIITFYMFRSCLRSRAEKLERGTPRWGALARVLREGGFLVALVVRYSAVPTHMVTALFAVCGMNFWLFLLTLTLSLPRGLAGIYIGVLALESAEGHPSKLNQILSNVILGITILITVIAMVWLNIRMKRTALVIIRERRAREHAQDKNEIKPFNPSALYDPSTATLNTMNSKPGQWANESSAIVFFGTRTPSPAPPNAPTGVMLPAVPTPAQVHADVV